MTKQAILVQCLYFQQALTSYTQVLLDKQLMRQMIAVDRRWVHQQGAGTALVMQTQPCTQF